MVGYVWRMSPLGVRVLFICSFLMNLGFYALIPYLTLYLTGSFAWSMAMAGILLGIRQFSQQGFSFLGGMLADRIGCKQALVFGVLVRAAGFVGFAFCTEMWQFIVAAILSGLGGALFEPAFLAAFARLTPEKGRKEIFAFRSVVVNTGMVVSTLVGGVLASVQFFYLSLVSGVLFIAVAMLVWVTLPKIEAEVTSRSWVADTREIIMNRPFVLYTVILIGYFYLYMQLFLTIPRRMEEVTGDTSGVAIMYATISLTVIALQLKVAVWLQNVSARFVLIGIGALVMGLSLFLLGFVTTIEMIIADGLLFAVGNMMVAPVLHDVVTLFAPANRLGSYYGFNSFSLAIGGALSTVLGGWLYDMGSHWNAAMLPWIFCLFVGFLVCLGMYKLEISRQPQALRTKMREG
ncbi:MDR family MFS transporter [Aneurinibacillus sp. REN35]|uniref:MDR family MFS transporter n=1 Tax=Aneurinibacillus sp. REN35 TaxID=3237286 RepID=UPI003528CE4E